MRLTRRRFLIQTGWTSAGLTVLGTSGCSLIPPLPTFSQSAESDILTWVQLMPNGRARFLLPRAEMGQGISTGLSLVIAEELNLPIGRVDCHYQDTTMIAACKMTVGSQSVESYTTLTATAAAHLREILRELAAERMQTEPANLTLTKGGFSAPGKPLVSYQALAAGNQEVIRISDLDRKITLLSERPSSRLSVLGKPSPQVNGERIVRGLEIFSRDVRLPGMLFGAIARAPEPGIGLKDYRSERAQRMDGVIAVVEHNGQVGVVAQTPMHAARGLDALQVEWMEPDDPTLSALRADLDVDVAIRDDTFEHTFIDKGVLSEGRRNSSSSVSARHDSPTVAHAAMEPRCGVASWRQDNDAGIRIEVWTGSQDAWLVRAAIARQTGLSEDQVAVHNCRIGGAFGGRVLCQASVEAAWLSQAVGRPVKVQWSREEEFQSNYVGPEYSTRIEAGLDKNGSITYWNHKTVSSPILTSSMFLPPSLHWLADLVADPGTRRGMAVPYRIENHLVRFSDVRTKMPTGPWRSLGAAPNGFAIESTIDELAEQAGIDPITFRLNHTDSERLAACLHLLRDRLDGQTEGVGIATAIYKDVTYLALAARVAIIDDQIKVTEMICIHDCGRVLSPDQVRAQVEGCLVWGIGMALHEEFKLRDGTVLTRNFDQYELARQQDVPDLTIELVDSEQPPSGAGEASLVPAAAAIANAVYAITGKRQRQLPIRMPLSTTS